MKAVQSVLTIGSAMRDIFITHQHIQTTELTKNGFSECFVILKEGSKIEVDSLHHAFGGGATNSAVSFKRLGYDVATVCKIGSDLEGQAIIAHLSDHGINTAYVAQTSDLNTGTSIIIPCPSGERTVLVYRGANYLLSQTDIESAAINQYGIVYVTSLGGKTAFLLPELTKKAKQAAALVAVNPGTSQITAHAQTLIDSLAYIDILIMNAHEASMLSQALIQANIVQKNHQIGGNSTEPPLLHTSLHYQHTSCSLRSYFTAILTAGPRYVVVTNGADGVYVAHGKTIYYHPSISLNPIVSTLGAGDAFGSCFTAELGLNKPITEALIAGIINSSAIMQHMDAQKGLLSSSELADHLKVNDAKKIKTYPLAS